jgi:outer membrane protein TolC
LKELQMTMVSQRRGVAVLALLLGTSWSGRLMAQPANQVPVMTLDEALAYARDHQPQIRSALAEWTARRAEAKVPRAQWLPQIGGTLQAYVATSNNTAANYLNVPEVDLPRIGGTTATSSTHWSPSGSTLAAISVGQEVYDFGKIAAQMALADAAAEVARGRADAVGLDVQLAVEETFAGVLAAKAIINATEDAYRRALVHRDYAQASTKSGLRPPIDLTRAQADVAQLEVRRIRAQSGLRIARAALAAAMAANTLEVDAQPIAPDQSPAPAFEEALHLALQNNPQVAAALSQVRAQESSTRAILRELYPNLVASAGISGRAGGGAPATPYGDGWLPDVANWHVGLVFQWNIFDGTVLARRSASRAREEAMRADLDLARTTVTLGTQRAYLDLDAALKAVPGLAQAVDAARANQGQADARFRAGLGTIVELADAENLLTNAQLELGVGEFAVARARAELGRAMGQLLTPAKPKNGNQP